MVVSGRRFKVDIGTLLTFPGRQLDYFYTYFDSRAADTMLGRMFNSGINKSNARGEYVLAEDMTPATFRTILQYYSGGCGLFCICL